MRDKIEFEDSLEEGDWGLIIDDQGKLKGLFIPDGKDDEQVPDVILEICKTFWGIDPSEEVMIH
jgi:hypothetical protein